jgi:glycosyltransferase involved in cell wall biosynthesis
MLGLGWFPDQIGGLDRYYRDLLERLPEARGIVIGPALGVPARVLVASAHEAPLAARMAAFWLAARRLASETDVVDAHFALYAIPCVLIGRLRRRPLVVHFQGPWAEETSVQGDGSRRRHLAREFIEKRVYRKAAVVVTLSGAFRRLVIERYGVSPWSVVVQPPGVDLSRFSPGDRDAARERLGVPRDVFVVSCVRRLVPRMGLSELLDAWEGLPGLLLVAGDGELAPELERRIATQKLGQSVRLLGRVSDDDLVDLYRAADLNVVPTLSFEGFGLVVVEAGGCGTPSVVTRVGGLPEAVSGLPENLVVPPGDVAALNQRLREAAAGALPSREIVRAWGLRYNWAEVVAVHRNLYRGTRQVSPADRRLRVVYLDHVARLSGGEIAMLRLLPALTRSVQPHVILGEEGPLVDRLVEQGASVEVLPMSARSRDLRRDRITPGLEALIIVPTTALYVLRLARRLRQINPDIVHTNSLKAGVYGSVAARLAGVPVLWHVRDRIDTDYLPRTAVAFLRVLIPRLASTVVANSDATLRSLGHRHAGTAYHVVPEVALAPRMPRDRVSDAKSLRIGVVGRLAPWKGQDTFLEAFACAFPDVQHRAVVIGAALFGEDAYATALHLKAESLGIASRVEFRGFREDVMSELAELDILVHASTTPEPFGQVVLEGLVAGVPVVASSAGGPGEIITDGVNGLLYPGGDARRLASRLRELAEDRGLRSRLSAAGRVRAQDYSPAAVADQMMRAYSDVAAT